MDEAILKVENLTKIYGKGCNRCFESTSNKCSLCDSIIAVRNVSFPLYKGEILGIMGESGSGKTTLLKCLYFDVIATFGEVYLNNNGKSLDIFKFTQQTKRRIKNFNMGMVYQNPRLGLNFDITSGANVAEKLLMAEWRNYSSIRQRISELFQKIELHLDRIDDLPSTLSGGMQQRVQIAKALANNPDIVFLDEPTSGLDVSVQARLLDLIKKIQRDLTISMIIVSHDLRILQLLADRILVMKEGRIVESGLKDQILEDPQHPYTQLLVSSIL